MSLYDKYHSNINIDYIWNILSQLVYKETNEDIKENNDYKQIFIENSKNIFKKVNSDELSELNKILLDESVLEFTNNDREADITRYFVASLPRVLVGRDLRLVTDLI